MADNDSAPDGPLFLLFVGMTSYPDGGVFDYKKSFPTLALVETFLDEIMVEQNLQNEDYWAHAAIFDPLTLDLAFMVGWRIEEDKWVQLKLKGEKK